MGFTGHEMLDDVGLIHINGRVYDPTLARFLSTDPYTQDKWFGTLAFNRYSYVQNNPLSYVDPTGLYSQAPNGMGTSSDAATAQARASDTQAMANTGAIGFGQRTTRTNFDMLFYILLYLAVFCIVITGTSNKRFSPLKVTIFSLTTSVCLLLFWNFFLGPIVMTEPYGGVSVVLSSILSIAILFSFSMALYALHYAYRRMVK
ncbi:RHS repeat-associated core domain-containing protein [Vibrio vulnificus]|uniref:RHS repeat-associated core domain-containing protein n=1 Tax=Vibrio vulnificus TaxID=672 RepID=UPI001CCCC8FB|nr:RHS repeat-associated core domain-containing protein [Vibrio vulnificus]MCA0780765.1 RHS repeat-associated core domain-containing protein [Vibrio vulnificus]